jgi:membrane protease YdiL (CAAX protease family)
VSRDLEAVLVFLLVVALFLGLGPMFMAAGLVGAALVELVCLGIPSAAYAAARGGLGPVLSPGRPRPRHLLGAALIGATLWYVLVWAVMPLQERLAPTPPELERELNSLLIGDRPLWIPILLVGLVPAACEELLCRGVLLRGLAARGRVLAIVGSAAAFALLHLTPYRFVPTFVLGLSLGFVALASRSLLPAILIHFIHNSMVLVSSREWPALMESPSLGLGIGALAICAMGHVLVGWPARDGDR